MDMRPIGIFDSGLGGLTTAKKLIEFLPEEDIIYLGDTGRVPYGSRSRETIIKYACQDAAFLAGYDIKAMVIACNTVCSTAYEALNSAYDMPVYEVVSAPAKAAAALTENRKIGVIGTAATIGSGAYETALYEIMPDAYVLSIPCPLFVPLVENGRTSDKDAAALTIAGDYLFPMLRAGVDTLIMGCTHYPLLRGVISKVMGPGVTLVDSGVETAKFAANDLAERKLLARNRAETNAVRADNGVVRYFVTDGIDGFQLIASRYMESDVTGRVEQISLE